MHDLRKYAEECMAELDRLGIKYARDIRFTVNSRAVTRLGQCRKKETAMSWKSPLPCSMSAST